MLNIQGIQLSPIPARIPALIIGLFFLIIPGKQLIAADLSSDHARDASKLEELRERINNLQDALIHTRDEHAALNKQLAQSEQTIARISLHLRELDTQMQQQQEKLGELQTRESRQMALLERERQALTQQIQAAYAMGRQERLKILFNQQNPDKVSRMMAYYDYLNRARATRMEEIEKHILNLRDTQASISVERTRLQELKRKRLEEKRVLEKARAGRQKLIADLQADINRSGRELEELQQDERRLEKLLAGIKQVLEDTEVEIPGQVSFGKRKGQLPWPSKGIIRAFFGGPKIGSLRWDGVMIGAPEGRDIHAVHPGRVAYADWLRGFGLLLIIDHGDGYMTLYGHNQSLFKEPGDWVEAGEAVASIGSSGGKEKAGVYFSIRYKGKPVNPTAWCKKPRGRRVGVKESATAVYAASPVGIQTNYGRLSQSTGNEPVEQLCYVPRYENRS